MESILTEKHISSPLVEQFGLKTMHGRTQLVSLFYSMGMLTFAEEAAQAAAPVLTIPNLVIRALQWEYLALAPSRRPIRSSRAIRRTRRSSRCSPSAKS